MKKKTTSKIRVFQDQSFIKSLCKSVGALGLSCISFFIYEPKSSNSNIVLNISKNWMISCFPLKPCVK